MNVSVIDSTESYLELMKSLFDFNKIMGMLNRNDFSMCIDGMHGAAGPYVYKTFIDELGLSEE